MRQWFGGLLAIPGMTVALNSSRRNVRIISEAGQSFSQLIKDVSSCAGQYASYDATITEPSYDSGYSYWDDLSQDQKIDVLRQRGPGTVSITDPVYIGEYRIVKPSFILNRFGYWLGMTFSTAYGGGYVE